jgi:hypothetical protein
VPVEWMPEGNTVMPSSDMQRTLAKWCQMLFDASGNRPTVYPEGAEPLPSDDCQRLLHKINALKE